MQTDRASRTAEGAAAVRAAHHLYAEPVIFDDPFAIELTSATWRRICQSRVLHWLVFQRALRAMAPVAGQVLGRARWAEDALARAMRAGIAQYVLIGAGLDSFALRRRDLEPTLRVFELDHPLTQRAKREKLARLHPDLPKNLEFAPVDFEREGLDQALSHSSPSRSERTFFSWLGVTPYLTRDAIFATLEAVRRVSASGSEIALDYGIPRRLFSGEALAVSRKLRRFTDRRGEPLIDNDFDPERFPAEVCALGFELVENLSPAQQKERYFANRSDGLVPLQASYFAHFRAV